MRLHSTIEKEGKEFSSKSISLEWKYNEMQEHQTMKGLPSEAIRIREQTEDRRQECTTCIYTSITCTVK